MCFCALGPRLRFVSLLKLRPTSGRIGEGIHLGGGDALGETGIVASVDRCTVDLHDRGDDLFVRTLTKDEVELPERLASGFEFTKNRKCAHFCSERCAAQVLLPPLDQNQLDNHVSFIVARHAVSNAKRITNTTREAFAMLSRTQLGGGVREWLACLENCYLNENSAKGLEPIYSILAQDDPCVQFFLSLIAMGLSLIFFKGTMLIHPFLGA
jgi:hypothetical protein